MPFEVVPYSPEQRSAWDAALDEVRQSSFLFKRAFMDYHSDRFRDQSLLIVDVHQRVVALLPACQSRTDARTVESHGGLTYGGLLTVPKLTTVAVGEILALCIAHYRAAGYAHFIYKSIPYIYHKYPSEEDLYWLFRHQAQLQSRAVSSVIDLTEPYPLSELRRRKVRKAANSSLQLLDDVSYLPAYWSLLTDVLRERHDTAPVHTLSEIMQLAHAFPQHIRLLTAWPTSPSVSSTEPFHGAPLAGCLLFITARVVHVQYIAASDEACRLGVLDWLFHELLTRLQRAHGEQRYLDFGISTECGGSYLNEGLIFQKEGFGARALCYDTYYLTL